MVERQQGDGRADPDPAGALGDDRHHHERARQERERAAEMQLGQPGHVEAERVPERDEIEHLGVAVGVGLPRGFRRLIEESKAHGRPVYITGAGACGMLSHCAGSCP